MRICIAHFRVITQGTFRLIGSPDVSCIPIHLGSWFFLIHNSIFSQGSIWRHNWGFRFLWFWLKFFGYFFCWSSIRRFALFFKKRRKLLENQCWTFTIYYNDTSNRQHAVCTVSQANTSIMDCWNKKRHSKYTAQMRRELQCFWVPFSCALRCSCGRKPFLTWMLQLFPNVRATNV